MADGRLRRLFWRVADHLDYLVTLAWLRILDALAGSLPETQADQQWGAIWRVVRCGRHAKAKCNPTRVVGQ